MDHAEQWMAFPENIGEKLSIDEVAVSNGELYTVITNKAGKGKKGALVAMAQGTKSSEIGSILIKMPLERRLAVNEITMDMAGTMEAIAMNVFPNAIQVTDRFHVQQLVGEAVQEIRIAYRREAMTEENKAIKQVRKERKTFCPFTYENGDTQKQLLARSRYLLFKPTNKWHAQQIERAEILFREFSKLKTAYNLSMMFRSVYEQNNDKIEAKINLDKWYQKIEEKNIDSFTTACETIRLHETTILNYFTNRSTNASAESFNAKLKGFRAVVRGVRDKKFYLFRVAKLYG